MRRVRIQLLIVTFILICIGVVMIYSASSVWAQDRYKDGMFFLKRQLAFLSIGAVLTFLVMSVDYRVLRQYAKPLLAISLLSLVAVLVPGIGREVAGAKRWFRIGMLSFQPSELASMAVIIYVSDFISRKKAQMKDLLSGFLPPLFVLGFTVLLILMQPDLGSSMALAMIVFMLLFIAGAKLSHLISVVLLSIPALYVLIFSVPYRRARIMAFLNPWVDPKGSGFQLIQSNIALGSGGIFGLGLGMSNQKLFYLPAAHTDFIFSIIGEELGLLGALAVCILFIIFIIQGFRIAKNSSDTFGYFLSLGIILMIALKAVINIGVSTGLFPTKGLPLPFISYGGSSLIFDMIGVGLLLNVARGADPTVSP